MRTAERTTTHVLAPGVRLHLVRSARFATTWCRVALVRDLGEEAAATAVLAACLQGATEASPTRRALAHRLADLHGATLGVTVAKPGDASLLVASLEWPTAYVAGGEATLAGGLELLREILTRPVREARGAEALDAGIVERERRNHRRGLLALEDDKARLALRRCLEVTCRGEPYGLDVLGRIGDLEGVTPRALGRVHARLIRRAPVEIFLVGDLGARDAMRLVRRHLLWPGRAKRPSCLPRVVGVRPPPARCRRVGIQRDGVQARLALSWRAAIRPSSKLLPAALAFAGMLGGGPYARLFQVLREEHGLCYEVQASWHVAKGILTVETGVAPPDVGRALRVIRSLVRTLGEGRVDAGAREGFRQAVRGRVATLRDDRGAMVGARQEALLLGTDPSPARLQAALDSVDPAALRRFAGRLGAAVTVVVERECG